MEKFDTWWFGFAIFLLLLPLVVIISNPYPENILQQSVGVGMIASPAGLSFAISWLWDDDNNSSSS